MQYFYKPIDDEPKIVCTRDEHNAGNGGISLCDNIFHEILLSSFKTLLPGAQ